MEMDFFRNDDGFYQNNDRNESRNESRSESRNDLTNRGNVKIELVIITSRADKEVTIGQTIMM